MRKLCSELLIFLGKQNQLGWRTIFSLSIGLWLVTFCSTGFAQYSGNIEWESPNFGETGGEGIKIGDMDGDGSSEIIAINGGHIHVFGYNGTSYQEEWQSNALGSGLNSVDIADLDLDGRLEIVVGTLGEGDLYIYIFGFDGSAYQQEWQSSPFSGDGYNGIRIKNMADVDKDGIPEIIATSDGGGKGYVWIFGYDGTTYQKDWESGLIDEFEVVELQQVVDIDGDGTLEMVVGGNRIHIFGYNGTDYQLEWESNYFGHWAECEVGNVDDDYYLEIVAPVEEKMYIYGYNGTTYLQEWQSGVIYVTSGRIADLDKDGISEIAVGSESGQVYVFGYNGITYQVEWQTTTPSPYVYVEKIGDFDQDGNLEILVQELTHDDSQDSTYYCDVYGYDGATYQLEWRAKKIDSYFGGILDPAADFDNDGIVEEVRPANNEDVFYPFSIYVIGPAEVTTICSPDDTLIAQGGTIGLWVTLTNNTDEVQTVYFATNVTLPNGNIYPASGYLFGPYSVTLNPYQSSSGHLSHTIPGYAPIGTYTYHGYVGNPDVGIISQYDFDFAVTTTAAPVGIKDWETTLDQDFAE